MRTFRQKKLAEVALLLAGRRRPTWQSTASYAAPEAGPTGWHVKRYSVGQQDILESKPFVVMKGDMLGREHEFWRGDAGRLRRFGSEKRAEKAARAAGLIV